MLILACLAALALFALIADEKSALIFAIAAGCFAAAPFAAAHVFDAAPIAAKFVSVGF